jgi:hypothetical protein
MAYGQVNADVIGTSVAGSNIGAGNASIMKNRIINGAMVINQRGFSGTVTVDGGYTLDRFASYSSVASKYSVSQNAGSVTPPVGFTNYLGVTSLSAYSVGSGDYFALTQKIEGYNIADLMFGTANAKTITLSFQVYSSLTGTFGGCIRNGAGSRSYPFTYTISSANTWTTISITVAGDTTGTWATDNSAGMFIWFGLGVGSTYSGTAGSWSANNYLSATGATSVVGTSGATFYITGVQLEVGSSATGFEYRQYQQELSLCQRYLPAFNFSSPNASVGVGTLYNGSTAFSIIPFPVLTRVPATGASISGSYTVYQNGSALVASAVAFGNSSSLASELFFTVSGGTAASGAFMRSTASTGQILFTGCEL